MNRRTFLQASGAAAAVSLFPGRAFAQQNRIERIQVAVDVVKDPQHSD